jgi:ubiquinol-cytochrome c reductase cytochrome b subunit
VLDTLVLGLVGSQHPEGIWILLGRVGTLYYFGFFLALLPLLGWFEKTLPLPASISESVLGGGALNNPSIAAKPMEKA